MEANIKIVSGPVPSEMLLIGWPFTDVPRIDTFGVASFERDSRLIGEDLRVSSREEHPASIAAETKKKTIKGGFIYPGSN